MKTRKSCFQNVKRPMGWAMLCLAFGILGLGDSATAQEDVRVITIDAPGAGTGVNQGTQSIGINDAGEVTGFYADSNNVVHGFVRAPNGAFTTFDAPGAGSENVSGLQCTETGCWGQGTYAIAINMPGTVTGFYADPNDVFHGFVRTRDGEITTFDAPGAGTGAGQGTWAVGINQTGVIAGYYEDADDTYHGFVRAADGTVTPFDAPGAATGNGQGTNLGWNSCINYSGAIAGEYVDTNGLGHSFVRASDGNITEFEAPGTDTGSGQPGTEAYAINEEGWATGAYYGTDLVVHGYVRGSDGTFIEFEVPGATSTSADLGTSASDVNFLGVVTGEYTDESGVTHAFLRAPDGAFAVFDAPGAAISGAMGTQPITINQAGETTGTYSNAGYGLGVAHGFLAVPVP